MRWEAPDALHVTLRFIGAWPDEPVPELASALAISTGSQFLYA
ncbi:MAG: 2'-5' RNA ligase family protein [Terriglobales bacterium]